MNFIEMKQEAIKDQLLTLDLETKINIYNELELTDEEYYFTDFDEMIETYFDGHPADAARAAYFGNFTLTDNYYTLDVYGNIKSYNDYTLDETLTMVLRDHIDAIYNMDDYILTYFDLDEINEIEEETEEISARAADYWKLRKDRQQLFDEFFNNYGFCAFSEEQFLDGLNKLNCKESDLLTIFNGCFILKDKINEYNNIYEDVDITEILKNDIDLMQSAIYEELNNHEYIVMFDPEGTVETVFETLGLSPDDKTAAAAMEKATNLIKRQRFYYDF